MLKEYVLEKTNSGLKEKFRTFYVDENGELYICGEIFSNKTNLVLCAGCDGVGIISKKKSIFLPISWIKKEFKKQDDCELIRVIEKKIRLILIEK